METWKPVREYEGLYEASNKGRIRSLPRTTTRGKVLSLYNNPRNGYVYCSLHKGTEGKTARVHKLVYEAFKGRISDGLQIDHIDGDKTNNNINNLEAVTQYENMRRAYDKGFEVPYGVEVIDLDTKEVFISYADASRSVGGRNGEMVARVCRGERSHYRNHRFAHYDDYLNGTIPPFTGKNTRKGSEMLWR